MVHNLLSSAIGIGAGMYLVGNWYVDLGGAANIAAVYWMAKQFVVVGVMYWGWNWKRGAGYCYWGVSRWAVPAAAGWWASWRGNRRVMHWSA